MPIAKHKRIDTTLINLLRRKRKILIYSDISFEIHKDNLPKHNQLNPTVTNTDNSDTVIRKKSFMIMMLRKFGTFDIHKGIDTTLINLLRRNRKIFTFHLIFLVIFSAFRSVF